LKLPAFASRKHLASNAREALPRPHFWEFLASMKSLTAALALLSIASAASPAAAAGVGGSWRVAGTVSDRPFALDCHFEPRRAGFGGVCVEVAGGDPHVQPGRSHAVNDGAVTGSNVSWSYPVSIMLMKLEIAFTGTLEADRMSGTVTTAGRKGAFTAMRK
jgi:hypothetical protein